MPKSCMCFCNLGVLFAGVPRIRALLTRVFTRACDSWKPPYRDSNYGVVQIPERKTLEA